MKIAAIDVGSNSVRLLMWADGKTLYKRMCTTRLGEGLNDSPYLSESAATRTAEAVARFVGEARADGADSVFAFATAAVRSCANPEILLDKVKRACGVDIEVVSGEREARIGLLGALKGNDGGIIDVGGASTEVIVSEGGDIKYSKSVNIGTVRILDYAGRDLTKIEPFVAEKIKEYGDVAFPSADMYAVGGTATRLACIKHGVKVYNPHVTHGTVLTQEEVYSLAKELTTMPVESIREQTICGSSSELIGGGAMLLYMVMKKLGVRAVKVSESDNLEGYILSRLGERK